MRTTQYDKLAKLLTRKCGVTAMEIVSKVGTVSPHSRLAEMAGKGWRITRKAIPGKSYGAYFGKAPVRA